MKKCLSKEFSCMLKSHRIMKPKKRERMIKLSNIRRAESLETQRYICSYANISRKTRCSWVLMVALISCRLIVGAFLTPTFIMVPCQKGYHQKSYQCFRTQVESRSTLLFNTNKSNDNNNPDFEHEHPYSSFDVHSSVLKQRLSKMRIQILEEELSRPPNPKLTPPEIISSILHSLCHPDEPLPDSGYRVLLQSSTPKWRNSLRASVGAPPDATDEMVASALGTAISRPKNQFGILVNAEDAEEYVLTFPGDVLDFEDGTCWVESRLRDKNDNTLLAVLGWNLVQRPEDMAWLVDGLDWQDFRDAFRPGIGREEWMRICG